MARSAMPAVLAAVTVALAVDPASAAEWRSWCGAPGAPVRARLALLLRPRGGGA